MKTPKRRKRPEPKQPRWVVVRKGWVQYVGKTVDGVPRLALPLFSTRDHAVRFIGHHMNGMKRTGAHCANDLRPAEIGTVQGETLQTILDGAAGNVDYAWWIQEVDAEKYTYVAYELTEATE